MNDHDDLFDPTRFFRKTDPETSAKAAEQAEPIFRTHREKILGALAEHCITVDAQELINAIKRADLSR